MSFLCMFECRGIVNLKKFHVHWYFNIKGKVYVCPVFSFSTCFCAACF